MEWIDTFAILLSKQVNNDNWIDWLDIDNAVIQLFPRVLHSCIPQSMKLTVINNSCNYDLASPPSVSL